MKKQIRKIPWLCFGLFIAQCSSVQKEMSTEKEDAPVLQTLETYQAESHLNKEELFSKIFYTDSEENLRRHRKRLNPHSIESSLTHLKLAFLELKKENFFEAENFISQVRVLEDFPAYESLRQQFQKDSALIKNSKETSQSADILIFEKANPVLLKKATLLKEELKKAQSTEVIRLESAYDREKILQSLILKEAKVVISSFSSIFSEELARITTLYNIPLVNLSKSRSLSMESPYVFNFGLSPELESTALIDSIQNKKNAQICILHPDDALGYRYAQAFFNAAQKQHVTVKSIYKYPPQQKDFKNIVAQVLRAPEDPPPAEFYSTLIDENSQQYRMKKTSRFRKQYSHLFIPETYKTLAQILPTLAYSELKNFKLLGPSTWKNNKLLYRSANYLKNATVSGWQEDAALEEENRVPSSTKNSLKVAQALKESLQGIDMSSSEQAARSLKELRNIDSPIGILDWSKNKEVLQSMTLFEAKSSGFNPMHQYTSPRSP